MSTTEARKLTFDSDLARARALRLAISCREAARINAPEYRPHLRTKMRAHALTLHRHAAPVIPFPVKSA